MQPLISDPTASSSPDARLHVCTRRSSGSPLGRAAYVNFGGQQLEHVLRDPLNVLLGMLSVFWDTELVYLLVHEVSF